MEKHIIELQVDRLRLGMYVAQLDRPWLGTPFLFQGFEITSDDELAQLRRLCKVVYVEITGNDGSSQGNADTLAAVQIPPSAHAPAADPMPLRKELLAAREIHTEAKRVVTEVLDQLRRGKRLSLTQLDVIVNSMVESVFRNREAITWLARMKSKDDYIYNHSIASSVWALVFGRHLGLDKEALRSLSLGGMLLDVGKTRVLTELLRRPAKLNELEVAEVRKHVQHGLDIVNDVGATDARVSTMIATHHERFDGSGYPHGLSKDAIPLVGHIAGIVDCYDAMTSERSYAKPLSTFDAVRQLKSLTNAWFQPELVEQFIQAVGVFPTGTLVELNTGEVGVVIGQNRFRRLRPEVMLILDAKKQLRDEFAIVDLWRQDEKAGTAPALWIVRGLEPGAYDIDPTEYYL